MSHVTYEWVTSLCSVLLVFFWYCHLHVAVYYSLLQVCCSASRCVIVYYSVLHCNMQVTHIFFGTATHVFSWYCQLHVAVYCSVLQNITVCVTRVLQCITVCCSVLQCVTVYYSVLQCITVCYNVLQWVRVVTCMTHVKMSIWASHCNTPHTGDTLQHTQATHCKTLQHTATHYIQVTHCNTHEPRNATHYTPVTHCNTL